MEREKKIEKQKKIHDIYLNGIKRKKRIRNIIIFLIMLSIFSIIFSIINITNSKILKKVTVDNKDVSGLAIEEAQEIIQNSINENNKIKVKYNGEVISEFNIGEIDAIYDVETIVNDAYKVGRKGNIIENNYEILFSKIFGKNIKLQYSVNEELLNQKVSDIYNNMQNRIVENSYYIEDNNLIIKKGTSGIKVDTEEFANKIKNKLGELINNKEDIDLPAQVCDPGEINLSEIHNNIYKQMKNASINNDTGRVEPEINGVDFDIEEAQKIIQEDKDEYIIPLQIIKPEKTVADLGMEAFPDTLSTYTTMYDASNKNRENNLLLASEKIDGTIIMPGETFSYNQTVGKRTIDSGYKEAAVYVGGQVEQGVGGGICQLSSTLYNSVLLANLEIVERSNHHFTTSYVPAGRDATVSWGTVDFKFKNTRSYPIKIESNAKNGIQKVNIKGIREDVEYEVQIQVKTTEIIPYETQYIDDNNLEVLKAEVDQKGINGCKTETKKITKLGNSIISEETISKDTYASLKEIIRKGPEK